ncbi:hypothetical protein TREES_T100014975 [Tupaia chinensis]|uniref:Uncharacterized protein n=1 Tax=Tupaia chinensis TaxID=246437 RepID=L9KRF9_TUPCH|nr:hypothetical protein TREES_T100014975 [Tupaia chinensis]
MQKDLTSLLVIDTTQCRYLKQYFGIKEQLLGSPPWPACCSRAVWAVGCSCVPAFRGSLSLLQQYGKLSRTQYHAIIVPRWEFRHRNSLKKQRVYNILEQILGKLFHMDCSELVSHWKTHSSSLICARRTRDAGVELGAI